MAKKVDEDQAPQERFQLLPKELDAGALDGEELLPVELLEFRTTPAGALDGEVTIGRRARNASCSK